MANLSIISRCLQRKVQRRRAKSSSRAHIFQQILPERHRFTNRRSWYNWEAIGEFSLCRLFFFKTRGWLSVKGTWTASRLQNGSQFWMARYRLGKRNFIARTTSLVGRRTKSLAIWWTFHFGVFVLFSHHIWRWFFGFVHSLVTRKRLLFQMYVYMVSSS